MSDVNTRQESETESAKENATPKLGFGLMRLPRRAGRIDIAEFSDMVDMFLDAGLTYFDTAYVYPGSEAAAKKALVERHPRESYTLATKLYAPVAPTAAAARKQIRTSLERLGTEYVDYYLLHAIMESNWKRYDRLGLWDYAKQLKSEGLARRCGFSFHAGPELLDRLLTEHPEVDFVQLQINYADWDNPSVKAHANYDVARSHNVPIVVMEPVKGGRLANPPREVADVLRAANPNASFASWAIRFAASLEGILAVLSGMSSREQMADNLSYMGSGAFRPLDQAERATIRRAQALMGNTSTIACTSCRYCTAGCPQGIPIPDIFSAMNEQLGNGNRTLARQRYAEAVGEGNGADACLACHACERACPQHLQIVDLLKQCAKELAS